MSHGHEHKDYKKVFGDIERGSKGLFVLCDVESPKAGTDVRQQSRTVCLGAPYKACKSCEHSTFTIQLKPGIGNQQVACPQWRSDNDRLKKVNPTYDIARREQCFSMPYDQCSFCPNKDVNSTPRSEPGWWEEEKWKK